MYSLFYIDYNTGQRITYSDLLEDIRNASYYSVYCKSKNYYEVFRSIIISMLLGQELVLLDEDFTPDEVKILTGKSNPEFNVKPLDRSLLSNITSLSILQERLSNVSPQWQITLFTSGTTGLPKKISHNIQIITRSVRHNHENSTAVWGFAYNPTHMAGIQVFFQAILNKNCIVRLFGLSRKEQLEQMFSSGITHISATPTFFRLLLPVSKCFPSVVRLTSGGERFDVKTFKALSKMFPNAKITNVYASTEAGTVLASTDDYFAIKPEYSSLIKIEDNELFLHKKLMGSFNSLNLQDDCWYATGDIVEIVEKNPIRFKFISRKNEMINVGGYKVNPSEIEDILRSHLGVQDAYIYGKSNSLLGNVICAEVVRTTEEVTESALRSFLQNHLQEFKIPRMIRFVESLKVTRTGKVQR